MRKQQQTKGRTVALFLLLFSVCIGAFAQKGIEVSGKLTDAAGEELIGASVFVKGNTANGTVSDLSGDFKLTVPSENSVVVFSYVGMVTKEVKVGKKRVFNISLEEDN